MAASLLNGYFVTVSMYSYTKFTDAGILAHHFSECTFSVTPKLGHGGKKLVQNNYHKGENNFIERNEISPFLYVNLKKKN